MKKFLFLPLLLLTIYLYGEDAIKVPKDVAEPGIIDKYSNDDKKENIFNIQYQNQRGIFGKGVIKNIKGVYLNLTWEENETGDQEILIDFIKSIRVKGYTMVKKQRNNLSVVFYFPYVFDLKLKDGKIIKNAKGRIKELESFSVHNLIGRQKCYTYFIRYWLEDKQKFNDNMSSNYNEAPKVPNSVIIYIEF